MAGRAPIFLALTRSSRLIGLPYAYAVLMMVICALPLIWLLSAWSIAWACVVYVALRIASEYDDKTVEVFLRGIAAVPATQGRKLWGGDSYGP